jgi:hypothetical protein
MELPYGRTITPKSVEEMHVRAVTIRRNGSRLHSQRTQGLNAAKNRDPKLMYVLEQSIEVLNAMVESQMGDTMRSSSTDYAMRVPPTDMQMWREAYVQADNGVAMQHFSAIYAAAGEFAGVVL